MVEPGRDAPKIEWKLSLLHRLLEVKCHHESLCVPATSDGCDTAQVAESEIYLDSRLEQRLPSDSDAKGSATIHRFYGAWHGPLRVHSEAIRRGWRPSHLQHLSDKIIGPEMEPHAFSYLDDMTVVSATFEEHIKWLEHVLTRIKDAGLKINRDKSEFGRSEVKFLGVLVNRDGFKRDPDKIAPIMEYPMPKNLKQLRRFLGMASWFRKFLPEFATMADSLTHLTKSGVAFVWSKDAQSAFEQIKALIASAPILHRPSFDHPFVIQTDANDSGLDAVSTQTVDGVERV